MGEERRKKNRCRSLHSQAEPLPPKKEKKNKNLVSASFQSEWKRFPSLVQKKRRLQRWKWDKNKKKSLWRLESSTLPCVSFRALERLKPMQETAWSSGGRAAGGRAFSLSLGSDGQICSFAGKVMNYSYSRFCSDVPKQRKSFYICASIEGFSMPSSGSLLCSIRYWRLTVELSVSHGGRRWKVHT